MNTMNDRHLYSVYFAPRGVVRMTQMGQTIAARHLSPFDPVSYTHLELLYQLHSQTNEDKGFFRVTALSAQGGRLYLADTTQEGVHRLLALDSATGEVLGTVYESDGGQIEAVRALSLIHI